MLQKRYHKPMAVRKGRKTCRTFLMGVTKTVAVLACVIAASLFAKAALVAGVNQALAEQEAKTAAVVREMDPAVVACLKAMAEESWR